MSMLRLTDRQTDRELALGQGYKAANNYAACSCVCVCCLICLVCLKSGKDGQNVEREAMLPSFQ